MKDIISRLVKQFIIWITVESREEGLLTGSWMIQRHLPVSEKFTATCVMTHEDCVLGASCTACKQPHHRIDSPSHLIIAFIILARASEVYKISKFSKPTKFQDLPESSSFLLPFGKKCFSSKEIAITYQSIDLVYI